MIGHPTGLFDEIDPKYAHLEFRQGVTEANPLCVALAAAIPVTKACLKYIKKDNTGKALLGSDGQLEYNLSDVAVATPSDMPKSQEEAAALFNPEDGKNPNFTFLDDLAAQRITRIEKRLEANPDNHLLSQELREARKLDHIGTRLHHVYCQEYGLQSHMPLPEKTVQASI